MDEKIREYLTIAIKSMKLGADDKYVFTGSYGDNRVYCVSPTSVKYAELPEEAMTELTRNKLLNCMFYVTSVLPPKKGQETVPESYYIPYRGYVESTDTIDLYRLNERYLHAMNVIGQLKLIQSNKLGTNQVVSTTHYMINNNPSFMDIINLSSAQGVGSFALDKRHIMLIAPCLIPMTKKSEVNLTIYDVSGWNKYVCEFRVLASGKKKYTTCTIMWFLYI